MASHEVVRHGQALLDLDLAGRGLGLAFGRSHDSGG